MSNGCDAARWTSKTSSARRGRVSTVSDTTLPGLVAELVASRRAGGYRFKVQERGLRQFADRCRREGYPDGSITKEAGDGVLSGGLPPALPPPRRPPAPPPPAARTPGARRGASTPP